MTRKFKMVGVLMAVVAMTAVMVSTAQARFTATTTPATATGTSTADVFDLFGSTVKCIDNSFTATLASSPNETITVHAEYEDCEAFGLPATVDMTSCDYVFHEPDGNGTDGTVDVVCDPGDAIDITVYSNEAHTSTLCHVKVPAQTGKGKGEYSLTNVPPGVNLSGKVGGLTATQSRTNFLCPPGTHTTGAIYTIQSGGIYISQAGNTVSVD